MEAVDLSELVALIRKGSGYQGLEEDVSKCYGIKDPLSPQLVDSEQKSLLLAKEHS